MLKVGLLIKAPKPVRKDFFSFLMPDLRHTIPSTNPKIATIKFTVGLKKSDSLMLLAFRNVCRKIFSL